MSRGAAGRALRRRVPWWVLALVFVVLPMVEIYVLIQIGQVIGAWWTVLLLIADGMLGSWLIKHEGIRAWAALTTALRSGRMPTRELADGALILVGGTLLVTPGFVSDIAGLFCILPVTRPWARRLVTGYLGRRLVAATVSTGGPTPGPPAGSSATSSRGAGRTRQRPGPEAVVQGEVVD